MIAALAGSVVDPTQSKQTDAGNALLFVAMDIVTSNHGERGLTGTGTDTLPLTRMTWSNVSLVVCPLA
jgi:hypothetical protein